MAPSDNIEDRNRTLHTATRITIATAAGALVATGSIMGGLALTSSAQEPDKNTQPTTEPNDSSSQSPGWESDYEDQSESNNDWNEFDSDESDISPPDNSSSGSSGGAGSSGKTGAS